MVDPELLKILVCPENKTPVTLAGMELVTLLRIRFTSPLTIPAKASSTNVILMIPPLS